MGSSLSVGRSGQLAAKNRPENGLVSRAKDFHRLLRHALNHLYDPDSLRLNPLRELLAKDEGEADLARVLRQTIDSMKPPSAQPASSPEWRMYELLFYRYVQRAKQADLARQFSCSIRQLRREQTRALAYLAERLMVDTGLTEASLSNVDLAALPDDEEQDAVLSSEFRRLRDQVEANKVDLYGELCTIVDILNPLLTSFAVEVDTGARYSIFHTAMPEAALRQVLLGVLSDVARSAGAGQITIACRQVEDETQLAIRAVRNGGSPLEFAANQDVVGLLRLAGGALDSVGLPDGLLVKVFLPLHRGIKVLVIDDNRDVLQLMGRYSAGTPYYVITCAESAAALQLVEAERPAMIVLDIMMSGLDGWQLLRQLRSSPISARTPIIVSTVLTQDDLARSLGADDVLHKPVNRAPFLEALDRRRAALASESATCSRSHPEFAAPKIPPNS